MGEWQDIVTFNAHSLAHVLVSDGNWVCEGYLDQDSEEWWATNNHPTDHWGEQLYPTHWMPLPEPPAQEERRPITELDEVSG